ncbi:MAG: alkaline shock response membrane anchor protein AmaP [Anaerolineae bacterium]
MNTFNRVVVILLLLATIIVMTVVLVVPRPMIEVVQRWLSNLDANLELISPPILLMVGVVLALLVDVICAVLIWFEIRRRRPRAIKVRSISGGQAELTVDSVARRLEHNVSQLDGVISVEPNVLGKRRGVEVEIDLETSPEVNVPAKTEEVCQVTREVVEDKMGLKLRKVRVNIKHAPYPTEPPMVSKPTPPPTELPIVSGPTPDTPEPPMASEDV